MFLYYLLLLLIAYRVIVMYLQNANHQIHSRGLEKLWILLLEEKYSTARLTVLSAAIKPC